MKAMIMAAGLGTRLMPLTMYLPKPMIPLANQPLMERTVKLLAAHGIKNIMTNLHTYPQIIRDYFDDGKAWDVNISYSWENNLLGTAGGVKKCEIFFDDTFVIVSGDALTSINLTQAIRKHKQLGALGTIIMKKAPEVSQYGVIVCDESGRIRSFQEKPKPIEARSDLANTGIYVFEPEIFKYIPKNSVYDFGKQLFPELLRLNAPLFGIETNEYWCDIGDIEAYKQAHWDVIENRIGYDGNCSQRIEQENGVLLLGLNANISDHVKIFGNVVVGAGCTIGDHVSLENTIIWDNAEIGNNVKISNAIVGYNCCVNEFDFSPVTKILV